MNAPSPSSSMVQLEHWSNVLAPLNEVERASVNALADYIGSNNRPNQLLSSKQNAKQNVENGIQLESHSVPSQLATTSQSAEIDEAGSEDRTQSIPSLPTAPLIDAPSYLSWYAKQQAFIASSTQSGHSRALQEISRTADEADTLLDHLEAARVHIAELRAGAQMVEEGTEGLREDAESMVERIDHLANVADALSIRLTYFAILPSATSFLSSPSLELVKTGEFMLTLDRLDVALAFIGAHPHYKDAPLYKMRFEHCIVRAGTLIRMFVVGRLKELNNEISQKLKEWEKSKTESSGKGKEKEFDPDHHVMMNFADPSIYALLFERYEKESAELQPILHELEKRASLKAPPATTDIEKVDSTISKGKQSAKGVNEKGDNDTSNVNEEERSEVFRAPEFSALLEECRAAYFDGRRALLSSMIANCIARIEVMALHPSNQGEETAGQAATSSNATTRLVERGMSFLTAINQAEASLYAQFFAIDDNHLSQLKEAPNMDNSFSNEADSASVKALHSHLRTLSAPLDDRIKPRMANEGGLAGLPAATLRSIEAWRDYFVGFLG
ncbi:uncharacterized protein FA14DRAFT_187469 [Meira miltonrushii]|uniref:Conserved oligomeric Golgi complex subunit 3 n=1 Tax=Meira miltonrushii TaxID=1280837 RepID=A0A316VI99_9BASI|nr:uncharacterized protein FA14DRAFT_187469 [Meira miltonrushii]PWN37359.1 hypothetical protein FA14DRAFT_187469 [Meira miltonrushii]